MSGAVPWWTFAAFAAVVGLVIGSFLNVVILRRPLDRSLIPPSACPRCTARLTPLDLVPVLSWVLLRGRCRHCQAPISPQYPLVEALTGLVGLLTYVRFVPGPAALDLPHAAAWLVYFTFLCLLVVVVYVDVRHHLILDETSVFAVPLGIAGAALLQALGYEGWLAIGWRASVLGAAVWGAVFLILYFAVAFVLRREGLGLGDVKLLAMLGAFLGAVPGTFMAVLIGSLAGSVLGISWMIVRRRRDMLPMGPPLAFGAGVVVLFGDVLVGEFLPGMDQWLDVIGWLLGG